MLELKYMNDQKIKLQDNGSDCNNTNKSGCGSSRVNCDSNSSSCSKNSNDPKCILAGFAKLMSEYGLTEIEYKDKNFEIELKREGAKSGETIVYAQAPAPQQAMHQVIQHAPVQSAPVATTPSASAQSATSTAPAKDDKNIVKAELVGTAYLAPSPNDPNFVKVGDTIQAGQTLLIIECMKTMNMVKAPKAGKVTEIYVSNGQPIEYDEALVCLE